jgi:hypothetical protein
MFAKVSSVWEYSSPTALNRKINRQAKVFFMGIGELFREILQVWGLRGKLTAKFLFENRLNIDYSPAFASQIK